jgi:hypothetical protein
MSLTVTVTAASLTVVAGIAVFAFRLARRFVHLLDDVAGAEARPGVPERPSMLRRLAAVEDGVTAMRSEHAAFSTQLSAQLADLAAAVGHPLVRPAGAAIGVQIVNGTLPSASARTGGPS